VSGITTEKVAALVCEVLGRPLRHVANVTHVQPTSFHRSQPVAIALALPNDQPQPTAVQLYYRHVNQAEPWRVTPMQIDKDDNCRAAIPGEYTDSPYSLQYYFEWRDESGQSWLYPGLGASLSNQPYFVLRQI